MPVETAEPALAPPVWVLGTLWALKATSSGAASRNRQKLFFSGVSVAVLQARSPAPSGGIMLAISHVLMLAYGRLVRARRR